MLHAAWSSLLSVQSRILESDCLAMKNTSRAVFDYAAQQRSPRKYLIGIALVLMFHVILIWAINFAMATSFVRAIKGPVRAVLLEEDKPHPPLPPQLPPQALPPTRKDVPPPIPPAPAYVPPVVAPVASTVPAPAAITTVTNTPPPAAVVEPAPPPTAAPVAKPEERTAAVVNAAHCEKPEYPSASRRTAEEGTVFLRFLVGPDGLVLQSEVEKSSGFKRLDEAARIGLSKCKFKPATADGKPVEAWAGMKYTWRLE
jgi:protein TonB